MRASFSERCASRVPGIHPKRDLKIQVCGIFLPYFSTSPTWHPNANTLSQWPRKAKRIFAVPLFNVLQRKVDFVKKRGHRKMRKQSAHSLQKTLGTANEPSATATTAIPTKPPTALTTKPPIAVTTTSPTTVAHYRRPLIPQQRDH